MKEAVVSNQLSVRQRRAAVDFDGVLCADSPNIFEDVAVGRIPDLLPGAREGLGWLRKNGYEIVIFTCRPYEHRRFMENYLRAHELIHDYIVFHGKPRADVYIDDKAVRFTDWPEVIKQINQLAPACFNQEPNTLFEETLKRERWQHLNLAGIERVLDIGTGHAPQWPESFRVIDCVETDFHARMALRENPRVQSTRVAVAPDEIWEYDLVCLCGVLEHVHDPQSFLTPLAGAKRIFLTVPNGASFHRHVGRMLGVIQSFDELSEADRAINHERYYTADTLQHELVNFLLRTESKLEIKRMGSSGFKLAGNVSMSGLLAEAGMVEALNKAALAVQLTGENNFHGAELYVELAR